MENKISNVGFIEVRAGGTTDTRNGEYDCRKQGNVVGISFKNDGNQDIRIEFSGAKIVLTAGREFTHFTNYPYVNKSVYKYTFLPTTVPGIAIKEINIYILKAD